ncbi:amidohydrolase family protein [Achromobacter seleniivolatilans]|uniref:Amidohydrolase family protein n=1 Tax=Achromobacter seleniivolatilans TaxID=3047478 RepID=A0ABY9M6E0_9BURK|nr:amidohydrolase family protein [Achromobacter sp. R39]WMD22144.1 amidohydrolase family protein [Achromobacter sp. R39]
MAQAVDIGEEIVAGFGKYGLHGIAPATGRDSGAGPYDRIVLRGATLIDGTGAPPWGVVDIVVENNRIVDIVSVGKPGMAIKPARRPASGDVDIDCHGKFVTPGFIDCHAHIGAPFHGANGPMPAADYVYKLWLAHGVTTIREAGSFNGLAWTLQQKQASHANEIAAPHIHAYAYFPATNDYLKTVHTPAAARDWMHHIARAGADGVKFFGAPPAIMQAALAAAKEVGLPTCCHHATLSVSRMNSLTTANWGLTSSEHMYGLPEALMEGATIQKFSQGYDYNDEYLRFSAAGATFQQAAQPGSAKWNEVLHAFLEAGHTFVPTMNVYDANRDLMRARNADWHASYTHPTLWKYFQPQRGGHGAYWYRWSVSDEVNWRDSFRRWMTFLNDYKNLGGRVCAGSDSGFMFQLYGFGFIRELELLQEAGFNALEVLRAATYAGAELLGIADEAGSIEVGKRADLLVHDVNPLDDYKVLYGTGALRLDDQTNGASWTNGLRHVIKGGVVYDPRQLLEEVKEMVAQAKGE